MENTYWFYIDAYVHISIKKNAVLLYNPHLGKIIQYTGDSQIFQLVKRLQSKHNLRVIRLTKRDLENPVINGFVKNVREFYMGDLLDTTFSDGKPIMMPPIVKIQKDVEYLKKDKSRSIGEDIIQYLTEVSLYINSNCNLVCSLCSQAYRQFTCCTCKSPRHLELDPGTIFDLLMEIRESESLNVNILGGNIFSYTKMTELLSALDSVGGRKTFFAHYLNAYSYKHFFKDLHAVDGYLNILVTFPIIDEKLIKVLEDSRSLGLKVSPLFVIQSEEDFEKAESLITGFSVENYEYVVFYNKENLSFFEENIYIRPEDIEEARPSTLDIYTNGSINKLNFGKLTVFPDGRVYANVNETVLGILGKHSIYDLLIKELKHGKSWRKIRKNVAPCKSCIYEKLCPPISDYNRAVGKYNMCLIKK